MDENNGDNVYFDVGWSEKGPILEGQPSKSSPHEKFYFSPE